MGSYGGAPGSSDGALYVWYGFADVASCPARASYRICALYQMHALTADVLPCRVYAFAPDVRSHARCTYTYTHIRAVCRMFRARTSAFAAEEISCKR